MVIFLYVPGIGAGVIAAIVIGKYSVDEKPHKLHDCRIT